MERAVKFGALSSTVVTAESLEAAGMIKLINNSYRDQDLLFLIRSICDKYNIDAHTVINQANDGYPRDPIASPSPGVGGYCLTKDPFFCMYRLGFSGIKTSYSRKKSQ